ncbi:T9SS type A sorting domain-containing protein [Pontibacter pamirensis]|uniref:T9SS type A sorting domain-containing protein n=1 Tax=Pontibacter pamirensis TaxID=2562824 RepID=UPI00138A5DBB|nr:T9SS type A sorting domain-containing protein [Pontibacter pamirensis]
MIKHLTNRMGVMQLKHFLLLTLLFYIITLPLRAQAPITKVWDKTLGSSGSEQLDIAIPTPDGGYLLGGTSGAGIGGDKTEDSKGATDYWVVKLHADGTKAWDKTIGGGGHDDLRSIVLAPDGGYLLGGHSISEAGGDKSEARKGIYDFWVVKLNSDGTKAWDKTLGGSLAEKLMAVTVTSDGGYLLGGSSDSWADGDKTEASRGRQDFWLVKLNADGTKAWDKTFGGSEHDEIVSLANTPDGGYILGGWSSSGAGGDKTEASQGHMDYWVVKLNADGSKAWDKTLGGTINDYLLSVVVTSDGGYLLGGSSQSGIGGDKTETMRGGLDCWVVKLNSDGTKAWDKTLGGSGNDNVYSLAMTPDGGYLLGGPSDSESGGDKTAAPKGGFDYWLMHLDSDGGKVWDATIGGNNNDDLASLVAMPDGSYLLAGTSESGVSGNKTEPSKGGSDYWAVKLTIRFNARPTDITLSSTTVEENVAANSVVGTFTTTDADASDTHSYTLVAGDGDADNSRFIINGNTLVIKESPDFEAGNTYSIRVATNDGKANGIYEKAFTIAINDVQEAVTGIAEKENMMLKMYPNPANRFLVISFDRMMESVKLVNGTGSILLNKQGLFKQVELNTEALTPGVYIAVVSSKGKIYTRRIVIIK